MFGKKNDGQVDVHTMRAHLQEIETDLIRGHAQLIINAITDSNAREEIKKIIQTKYKETTNGGQEDLVEYITGEIVGTGIIEEFLRQDSDVTDIAFDGIELEIEGINSYRRYRDETINEQYVQKLMSKFAAAKGKDFSTKNPILNDVIGNIRINAVHQQNSLAGSTFSLRIVRPYLALNEDNFYRFAPPMILNLLKAQVALYSNVLIGGITGTGKTELQKLFLKHTKNSHEKIGMIQDVPETFAKEMNPDKTIYEWTTGNGITHTHLISAGMRNNFRWINVTEIIDAAAYALYQAVMSGHAVVTTLHAKNVRKLLRRLVQLAKQAPELSAMNDLELLREVEDLFDAGWFIKKEVHNGQMYRYLDQIAFFVEGGDYPIVFEQEFKQGVLHWHTNPLPEAFVKECERVGFALEWEVTSGIVDLTAEGVVQ